MNDTNRFSSSKPAPTLYDSLRVGYLPTKNQQGQEMDRFGYKIDKSLSNKNQQVYYNPENKKLLYNVTGSQSLSDWVNVDSKLALGGTIGKGIKAIGAPLERSIESLLPSSWKSKFKREFENVAGGFKDTTRYKEADETLKAAKAKYSPANVSITGHSLGGRIIQDIAKKDDMVFGLDPAQTIGQKVKSNQNIFRSAGDVVSLASAGSKNITTLPNPHIRQIIPALISGNPAAIGTAAAIDAFHAHDIDNIKGTNIII